MLFTTSLYSQSTEYIDIMILYSNEADGADIETHANAAINSLNTSFDNSGINTEANLVLVQNINYNQASTVHGNKEWLRTNSTVATLRNEHAADFVVLMIDDIPSNVAGKATLNNFSTIRADSAFAVVTKSKSYDTYNKYFVFAHEVGHLIGGMHQNHIQHNDSYYSRRGYEPDIYSKTIMASGDAPGAYILRWSDPNHISQPPGGPCPPKFPNCNAPVPYGTSTNNMVAAWSNFSSAASGFKSFYSPKNLTVSTGSPYGEPVLDWDDHPAENFDYYQIFRKTSISNFQIIATSTNSTYTDWTVANKYSATTQFQYAIRAVNTRGENSSYSNSVFYDGELMSYKTINSLDSAPSSFDLKNNYPNPFNPTTTISFALPEKSKVRINVYNINGQLVSSLVNEVKPAGSFDISFEASGLASGVYIARMTAIGEQSGNRFSKHIKMQLIK